MPPTPVSPAKRKLLRPRLLQAASIAAAVALSVGLVLQRRKPVPPVIAAARAELTLSPVLPLETDVRRRPRDPVARLRLARACAGSGDPAGAALALGPLIPSGSETVAREFASACVRLGWLQQAEDALWTGPGSLDVRLELASAWTLHGEAARAVKLLAPLEEQSLSAAASFTGAGILLRARDYPRAVRWAERGLKLAPRDHDGFFTLVRCRMEAGHGDEAADLFSRLPPAAMDAGGASSGDPALDFWRGRAELRCRDAARRKGGLQRLAAVAISQAATPAHRAVASFEAGRAYLELGHPALAVTLLSAAWEAGYQPVLCLGLLERAYAGSGHPREAAWSAGKVQMARHRWPEAVAAFRRSLALDQTKPAAYLDLARALSSAGKPAEALGIVRQAEKVSPRNVDLALLKAAVLGRLEQVPEEEAELTQTAGWAGGRANEPLGNLGKLLFDSQQFDRAIPVLERALSIDDGDALSHLYLGLACSRRPEDPSRAAKAVRHLLRAARLQPDYHYPWINCGSVLLTLGAAPEAAACYRRSIDGDPRWDGPYLALAQIYQRQGLTDERRFVLQRYAEARATDSHRQELETRAHPPTADAAAHYALGEQSLGDGRPKEALAELIVAAALKPDWKQVQLRIADACAQIDFDAMREDAERAAR